MKPLKIRKIGNSLGVILPRDLLAELGLGEGDEVVAARSGRGALELSIPEEDFARQMEVARKGMKRYRKALAELAK